MSKEKFLAVVCFVLILCCGFVSAETTITGNVTPDDPALWGAGVDVAVGSSGYGSIVMNGGDTIFSQWTSIGFGDGSGYAVLDGVGTKWTVTKSFRVAYAGSGSLVLSNGAVIESQYATLIGYGASSVGVAKITGSETKFLAQDYYLHVGYQGHGTLEVADGALVDVEGVSNISHSAGSHGFVLVHGAGSTMNVAGDMTVARLDSGALKIGDDGLVSVGGVFSIDPADMYGYVQMYGGGKLALLGNVSSSITDFLSIVTGNDAILYWNGSAWDNIVNATAGVDYTLTAGTGDLAGYTVLTVTAAGPVLIDTTVSGEVKPFDTNYWASTENLFVGAKQEGSLTVGSGDLIASRWTSIGAYAGGVGSAVLRDAGTKWTATRSLTVGYGGTGSLFLTDGAVMESLYASTVGVSVGANGEAVVSGSGSKWVTQDNYLKIASEGIGSLKVTNGGLVEVNAASYIAYSTGSVGSATVTDPGSQWVVNGDLVVGRLGIGRLKITNAGLLSVSGQLSVNPNYTDSYIQMSNEGQLALVGDGSASINDFLALTEPNLTDVYYWNGTDWDTVDNGVENVDYTLATGTGDLEGYTVLTVLAVDEQECMYDVLGDINGDCKVNFEDISLLATSWLVDCTYPYNMTSPECY